MGRTTKMVGFSVPPALEREVEQIAKAERRTKSELFREMLRVYKRFRKQRDEDEEAWVKNLLRDSHPYTTTSQVDPIWFLPFPAAPLQNDIRVSLPDKRTFGVHAKYSF